jgi:hypothetical protein
MIPIVKMRKLGLERPESTQCGSNQLNGANGFMGRIWIFTLPVGEEGAIRCNQALAASSRVASKMARPFYRDQQKALTSLEARDCEVAGIEFLSLLLSHKL